MFLQQTNKKTMFLILLSVHDCNINPCAGTICSLRHVFSIVYFTFLVLFNNGINFTICVGLFEVSKIACKKRAQEGERERKGKKKEKRGQQKNESKIKLPQMAQMGRIPSYSLFTATSFFFSSLILHSATDTQVSSVNSTTSNFFFFSFLLFTTSLIFSSKELYPFSLFSASYSKQVLLRFLFTSQISRN